MKSLRHPSWIFLVNTLPVTILALILFGDYSVIESMLTDESKTLWMLLAIMLGGLWLASWVYALVLITLRKRVPTGYAIIALVAWITWIYLYAYNFTLLFPADVPPWMLNEHIILLASAFIMPSLAHAMLMLVVYSMPLDNKQKTWVNWVVAFSIPAMCYVAFHWMMPLLNMFDFKPHATFILLILLTLSFLFFLIRGVYGLATKKGKWWSKLNLAWKIPVTLVLPVIGLLVNNSMLELEFVFGNFSSPWFFVLTGLNALALCLPQTNHLPYRWSLFVVRSLTLAFTLYFFMVFLPYLPFSIVAIVFVGAGFLMLSPLLLFVVHIDTLAKDFAFLRSKVNSLNLFGIAFAAFLTLPVIITADYHHDKRVLHHTLEYLYAPDYSSNDAPNPSALKRSMDSFRSNRKNQSIFMGSDRIPYLTSWYRWIVLDNMTLSDKKINDIERIFFAEKNHDGNLISTLNNKDVSLTNIEVQSGYDEHKGLWISQVNFEITNPSTNPDLMEYATTFNLPDGCWISDYHLYVEGKKKPGILAEKLSALWIFSKIREVRQDPGLLYYQSGNKIGFSVYPFNKGEIRKTRIEFLHIEPVSLRIDGHTLLLGDEQIDTMPPIIASTLPAGLVWISAEATKDLERVNRKPCFHFIIDASEGREKKTKRDVEAAKAFMEAYPLNADKARLSFVNSAVYTFDSKDDWRKMAADIPIKGGFFLDRAVRKILFHAWKQQSNDYPVMVVLSDQLSQAVVFDDFADLAFTFPESDRFYHLSTDGALSAHSLSSHPLQPMEDSVSLNWNYPVLAFTPEGKKQIYLADDGRSKLIPTVEEMVFDTIFSRTAPGISEALHLQSGWFALLLHPENTGSTWLSLVKESFSSGIMSPVTSYIVVETEAQKAALLRKQRAVLSGNPLMDLSETTQRMTEPGWYMILLLLPFLAIRSIRKKRHFIKRPDTPRNMK